MEVTIDVFLEDCSENWEGLIESAKEQIVIFTPFFDMLIIELLINCELPYSDMVFVTQLDYVDSSGKNIERLLGLVSLLALGINVRVLDRLHAKALIIDERKAIFGSQNFTGYSRGSYEISTYIEKNNESLHVFVGFEDWLAESRRLSTNELVEASDSSQLVISALDILDESSRAVEDKEAYIFKMIESSESYEDLLLKISELEKLSDP